MTLQEQKQVLTDYLKMKVHQEDWHGVADAANDLREIEIALRLSVKTVKDDSTLAVPESKDVPLAAIPPVDVEIPHHANEVVSLLKLSDEELVEKMFPDLLQQGES